MLDLVLMPASLLGFGIALGEEHWSSGGAAALGFSFAGLAVLFGPQIVVPDRPSQPARPERTKCPPSTHKARSQRFFGIIARKNRKLPTERFANMAHVINTD
jgi:hypothetical protein